MITRQLQKLQVEPSVIVVVHDFCSIEMNIQLEGVGEHCPIFIGIIQFKRAPQNRSEKFIDCIY